MVVVMTLAVAVFVVLTDEEIISPALKGLALSSTVQVRLTSKKTKVWFRFFEDTLQAVAAGVFTVCTALSSS